MSGLSPGRGLLISALPYTLVLLVGPVVSCRSDRHRGPRGRRIPFLAVIVGLVVYAKFMRLGGPQIYLPPA